MGNTAYSIGRIAHNSSFMRDVSGLIHTDEDRTMMEHFRICALNSWCTPPFPGLITLPELAWSDVLWVMLFQ